MKKENKWRLLTTIPLPVCRVTDIVVAVLEKHGKITRGGGTDARADKTAD